MTRFRYSGNYLGSGALEMGNIQDSALKNKEYTHKGQKSDLLKKIKWKKSTVKIDSVGAFTVVNHPCSPTSTRRTPLNLENQRLKYQLQPFTRLMHTIKYLTQK